MGIGISGCWLIFPGDKIDSTNYTLVFNTILWDCHIHPTLTLLSSETLQNKREKQQQESSPPIRTDSIWTHEPIHQPKNKPCHLPSINYDIYIHIYIMLLLLYIYISYIHLLLFINNIIVCIYIYIVFYILYILYRSIDKSSLVGYWLPDWQWGVTHRGAVVSRLPGSGLRMQVSIIQMGAIGKSLPKKNSARRWDGQPE